MFDLNEKDDRKQNVMDIFRTVLPPWRGIDQGGTSGQR